MPGCDFPPSEAHRFQHFRFWWRDLGTAQFVYLRGVVFGRLICENLLVDLLLLNSLQF